MGALLSAERPGNTAQLNPGHPPDMFNLTQFERPPVLQMRQPFPDTAATPPGYPPASYAWYVVGVLVLATVLSYTDRQILSLLVDPMRRDLQISDTQMGLLMGSAFAFVYGIAGIPLG